MPWQNSALARSCRKERLAKPFRVVLLWPAFYVLAKQIRQPRAHHRGCSRIEAQTEEGLDMQIPRQGEHVLQRLEGLEQVSQGKLLFLTTWQQCSHRASGAGCHPSSCGRPVSAEGSIASFMSLKRASKSAQASLLNTRAQGNAECATLSSMWHDKLQILRGAAQGVVQAC